MSNKIDKISPLGKRILESLEKQRLTKKFIYENLGISRGTLDNWISGATVPDYNEVQKMLKLLGIGDAQPKPFWDEIREGEYIGMHQRVWAQHEITMEKQREWLDKLIDSLANLRQAGDGQQR